ncbi:TlpA family protein disulfide reductase [Rubrivivax sp. RP6-9]|uniref:TlpA family protein disulfide reductase n=1 Tax=Rubrivivax sp. RP6-9 TaxID=3415750 RepID=UPI003CC5E397
MWHRIACWAVGLLCWAPLAQSQTVPEAAALVGRTTQGSVVDLAQLRGKVVLVFFWSTDCAVCLDLLPELRRNLSGWRTRPFEIVAVNQDRTLAGLQAYEKVLDRVVAPDPQMRIVWRRDPAHGDTFGEHAARQATTVVVDRAGQVVKTVRGRWPPALWDEIAELVLN